MKQAAQVDILLIWVNAERQLEQGLIGALEAHAGFTRPEIVERDAHQAEISAVFPTEADILEAIIDSLLALPDYDVEIQGAEKEHQPTVVFRAVPLHGRPKGGRPRVVRRHVDDTVQTSRPKPQASSERVLSTSEMAHASGPRPGIATPSVVRQQPTAESSSGTDFTRPVWTDRRGRSAPPRLVPLIKKIARIIFQEEEETPHQDKSRSGEDSAAPPEE